MTPFPIMPSRAGADGLGSFSYYDQVYLPESVNDLDWEHGEGQGFGPDSCAAYYGEGIAMAGNTSVQFNPRIAFDIDTPEDLHQWCFDIHGFGQDAVECLQGWSMRVSSNAGRCRV